MGKASKATWGKPVVKCGPDAVSARVGGPVDASLKGIMDLPSIIINVNGYLRRPRTPPHPLSPAKMKEKRKIEMKKEKKRKMLYHYDDNVRRSGHKTDEALSINRCYLKWTDSLTLVYGK